jgi:hypothetical protein
VAPHPRLVAAPLPSVNRTGLVWSKMLAGGEDSPAGTRGMKSRQAGNASVEFFRPKSAAPGKVCLRNRLGRAQAHEH